MEYFYDIKLSFDEYPINYYDWEGFERLLKVRVIRVDNISDIIMYHASIDLDDGIYILSDTINAIGIDVINNNICYLSYLKYDDENYSIRIAERLEVSDLNVRLKNKRYIDNELRFDKRIKKILTKLIEDGNDNLIKYIYYDITDKYSNDISRIKKFLLTDLKNNFSKKYINLYENIFQ